MKRNWEEDRELQSFQDLMSLKLNMHEGRKSPEGATMAELRSAVGREVSDAMEAQARLEILVQPAGQPAAPDDDHPSMAEVVAHRMQVAVECADGANQLFILALRACGGLQDLAMQARADASQPSLFEEDQDE